MLLAGLKARATYFQFEMWRARRGGFRSAIHTKPCAISHSCHQLARAPFGYHSRSGVVMGLVKSCSIALALVALVACGKSEAEKQAEEAAEQAKKAAEAMQKAAEAGGAAAAAQGAAGAAQGMEAFAKAMQAAAAAAGGDGKPVDPVRFQDLQTVLPAMSGWEMDKPRGEKMTMPVAFSQVEATYTKGDAQVEVKIVDSAFSQLLVAPWAMFLTAGYEKETSEGYEKSVNVGGNPGFEKWDSDDKDGELNLVVAKRFLVTIDGSDIGDAKVLHEFASKLDASKLAALK
jgi:hypothetical protein